MAQFSELVGQTIIAVHGLTQYSDCVTIHTEDNVYDMLHIQDCCEQVTLEDFDGDVEDILHSPVLVAEEVVGYFGDTDMPLDIAAYQAQRELAENYRDTDESYTWTFYKIDTAKGGMTLRWLGESNGYYSETVDFEKQGEG